MARVKGDLILSHRQNPRISLLAVIFGSRYSTSTTDLYLQFLDMMLWVSLMSDT
jgi:hypothetical protein